LLPRQLGQPFALPGQVQIDPLGSLEDPAHVDAILALGIGSDLLRQ
jgi:hypothetical protein